MSLQATANLLQQQGRNDDKMLVHMTPREVAGLEAIARAKGGSLTINPQTGLPEAGFLDDVLPIAASAALMYFGGPIGASIGEGLGLSGALAQGVGMGILTGGATTLLTGDINKGLKTGLTAGALSGAMAGLSGPSTTTTTPTANVETVTPALQASTTTPAATTLTSAGQGVNPTVAEMASGKGAAGMTPTAEKSWWGGLTGKEKLGYGLAGTAGLSLLGGMQDKGEAVPTDKGTIRPHTYTTAMREPQAGQSQYFQPIQYDIAGRPSRPIDTSERTYFNQGYTALPTYKAAAGGEVPPNLDHMQPGGLAAIQGMRDGYAPMTTPNGDIPQMATGGAIAFRDGGKTDNEDDDLYDLSKSLRALGRITASVEPSSAEMANERIRNAEYAGGMPERMVAQKLAMSQPDSLRGIGAAPMGMVEGSQMIDRMNRVYGNREPSDISFMPQSLNPKNLAGMAAINKQLDENTQLKLMAAGHRGEFDRGIDRVGAGIAHNLGKDSDVSAFYEKTPGFNDKMMGVKYNKRFALGGTATATASDNSGSAPRFTFDPATQQYTQTANPIQAIQQGGDAIGMGLISQLVDQGAFNAQAALPKYSYDPKLQAYKALAGGGQLGGYSDGGRMLKGPGDGMSDSIPGTINDKQPARLADGEFVVPADVVSHLGNGSTDAGAKRLYDMMDRVRKARTGTKKQGKQIKADKYLPK